MRTLVDEAKLAGVTTLVARHGKVVHFDVYGVQDLESKRPATQDTIFRIASMTKDPAKANTPEGKNSFYWGGAFGSWFWIDPTNDVIVVGMMQNLNGSSPTLGSPQVRPLSRKLVYAALVDPKK